MANKKPSKSVLDYDPLAWLGEDDESTEDTGMVEKATVAKKVAAKKTVTGKKTALKKAVAKKAGISKESSKKTVAKKPVIEQDEVTEIEAEDMNDANQEDQGFGFFNDAAEAEVTKSVAESEQDQGFGFFDSSEPLTTQSVELDDATNIVNLGAELTIRSVSTCKALIDENISNGFDIRLAAGDLQKIDTAGLQLIYSLNKSLEKTSQSISWESSNSIINDAALLIGMPRLLEPSRDEGSYGFF